MSTVAGGGGGGGAAGPGGGLYAPLRQLLSDSESEDECRKRTEHTIHDSESFTNLDINSGLQSSRLHRLSLSDLDDPATNLHTADTTLDNVSFLHSDAGANMSLPRKLAFGASILACLLTVVLFLWVVPCSQLSGCPASEWRDRTTSWELPYDDIELSGTVQIVDGAMPNSKNLVFIYRGNHMRRHDSQKVIDNGVVLIVGNSGKIGWYTREVRIPTQIDCHLLDVDKDGRMDCLVAGTEGLLTAINPLSGTYYWYLQRQSEKNKIISIDFPVVTVDLDGDSVSDLLTSATIWPNENHNCLLIVSGRSGQAIGEPFPVEDCMYVHGVVINGSYITYGCRNSTTEAIRTMSLQWLHRRAIKPLHAFPHHVPINKDDQDLRLKTKTGSSKNFFKNGKGKLVVDNSGECPNHCRVNLKLILERNGTKTIAWENGANHVFAMRPSSFAFTNSIHGFVMKL